MAFAFRGAQFSSAQQPAEAAIGGPVHGISEDVWCAIDEDKACADQQFGFVVFDLMQGCVGAHDTGQRVAVGDTDCSMAELCRHLNQFPGMRGTVQEGIIRCHRNFGVGVHAKTPCRNHFGGFPSQ